MWSCLLGPNSCIVLETKSPVEPKEWGDTWVWPSESILEVMTLAGSAGTG